MHRVDKLEFAHVQQIRVSWPIYPIEQSFPRRM